MYVLISRVLIPDAANLGLTSNDVPKRGKFKEMDYKFRVYVVHFSFLGAKWYTNRSVTPVVTSPVVTAPATPRPHKTPFYDTILQYAFDVTL